MLKEWVKKLKCAIGLHRLTHIGAAREQKIIFGFKYQIVKDHYMCNECKKVITETRTGEWIR